MEREVIAKRNTNSAVLDLVLAGVGACLLAYMIYLICTSEGLATIAMGIVIAVICAAFFAWLLVEGILIMRSPEELIVKLGAELKIGGKSYKTADISLAQLKMHRQNGGQFAFGNIIINLKNGGKIVCRGVADPQNAYKRFCGVIGSSSNKAAKGSKNG